jgi:CRP/FNR family cyclic AMP-dependent transcriptional regulator
MPTVVEQNLTILRRSWVFQAAPTADLERLASRCGVERYRRGARIARRGSAGESLFVLGRGRVKGTLPSPDADGEFLVSLFWPGDVFGEVTLFDKGALLGSAFAISEAEILTVPRAEVLSLVERRPAVSLRLMGSICEKLRTAMDLSLSLRFLDIPARFYQRLHYLARFDSRPDGDGVRIQHGLSQHELADSIGASREALNKVIGEWKREGLVEWGRGYVVVRDPGRLADRMPTALRKEVVLGPTSAGVFGPWPSQAELGYREQV